MWEKNQCENEIIWGFSFRKFFWFELLWWVTFCSRFTELDLNRAISINWTLSLTFPSIQNNALYLECGTNSSINGFVSTTTTPTKSIRSAWTGWCNAIFTLPATVSNATRQCCSRSESSACLSGFTSGNYFNDTFSMLIIFSVAQIIKPLNVLLIFAESSQYWIYN